MPTVIAQALGGGPIRLGALEPVRDFTFVTDTVAGLIAVGSAADAVGLTVNLGSGRGISVADLVALVANQLGAGEIAVTEDPARLRPARSEVARLVADSTLAHRLCGWAPAVALEAGLAATIEWVRRHRDRFGDGAYAI